MTTLRITVDDAQADTLRKMLQHIDLVKTIEQEPAIQQTPTDNLTPYEQLKKLRSQLEIKSCSERLKILQRGNAKFGRSGIVIFDTCERTLSLLGTKQPHGSIVRPVQHAVASFLAMTKSN